MAAAVLGMARWDDSLRAPRAAGEIRVGYAAEAPYAFATERGEVTGEDPELARLVAAAIGIPRITWVQVPFASLIPELLAHRFDVIAAGMFITPERAQIVAFSRPTFSVGPALLARAQVFGQTEVCAVLRARAEVRLAVLDGAVEGDTLRRCGVPDTRIVVVPDAAAGHAAVQTGLVSALAISAPAARWMAAHDKTGQTTAVTLAAESTTIGLGAFGFRPKDTALRTAWDAALEELLGTPAHLDTIARFGFTAEELPPAGGRR